MKRYCRTITVLVCLFFMHGIARAQLYAVDSVVYSSVNPVLDAGKTEDDMLHMDLGQVFKLGKDNPLLQGGIIGNAQGGIITLSVYYYDKQAPDGKKALLYECHTTANKPGYVDDATIWLRGTGFWMRYLFNTWFKSWLSTDIKEMALEGGVARQALNSQQNPFAVGAGSFIQAKLPVIVEVAVQNASVTTIKVPVLGEFNATDLFVGSRPVAVINGKITLGSHRGDWQDVNAPENTKNSVKDMFAEQYDMVELDLWSTLDSQLIVFHDMGLNKRTAQQGGVRSKNWSDLQGLYIKNRFEELIQSPATRISLLSDMLDYIKQLDAQGKVFLNLDRSANDISFFKQVYQLMDSKGMLDRAVFKGRFNPSPDANGDIAPRASTLQQAFTDMFPGLTQVQRDRKMRQMHYTPILFDNSKDDVTTNDAAFATKVKGYVDSMINAGIADGFELNFKSYPVNSSSFANSSNDNVFLLQQWAVLGDSSHPTRNFVEYIHSRGLPVGIFASVPEVCAVPDWNADGSRNTSSLVSGFVKENLDNFNPRVKDQSFFDFRGDWDFYVPAGIDFVISDRPDALREYLKAIGRL